MHIYRYFETNQLFIFAFENGFSKYNIHLYLCGQVENTKWILLGRKIGLYVWISDVQRVFIESKLFYIIIYLVFKVNHDILNIEDF